MLEPADPPSRTEMEARQARTDDAVTIDYWRCRDEEGCRLNAATSATLRPDARYGRGGIADRPSTLPGVRVFVVAYTVELDCRRDPQT
jgi:hypothetical protein